MKKIYRLIAFSLLLLCSTSSYSQFKVGDNPGTIDPSAVLELESTNKGLLLPRIALTSTTDNITVAAPATGLVVYNTATAGDVTPGIYAWDGAAWGQVGNSAGSSPVSFCSYAITNVTLSTPTNTTLSFTANANDFDNGNNFDGTNFVAPVAGVYFFTAQVHVTLNNTESMGNLFLMLQQTGSKTATWAGNRNDNPRSGNHPMLVVSGLFEMAAGDQMNLVAYNDQSINAASAGFFSGFLVTSGSGGGGASVLTDLTDVDAASPADGDILVYNTATSMWESTPPTHLDEPSANLSFSTVYNAATDGFVVFYADVNNTTGEGDFALYVDTNATPTTLATRAKAINTGNRASATFTYPVKKGKNYRIVQTLDAGLVSTGYKYVFIPLIP